MSFCKNLFQPKAAHPCKTKLLQHDRSRPGPGSVCRYRYLAGLVLIFSPVFAQSFENNHQFVEKALGQMAKRAVEPLDTLRNAPIIVAHRPLAQEAIERLLYQKVIELLLAEKFRVISASDTSAGGVRLDFKSVAFDLRYRKLPAGWFRSGKIRREVKAVADFDIQNTATGVIYFQGLVAGAQADTLPAKLVDEIETTELPFTIGRWEEHSAGKNILEPLLLAAATGAVIYAFYSLRSH